MSGDDRVNVERFYRPDHNTECMNCDEWLVEHGHEPGCPAQGDPDDDLRPDPTCGCRRPCPPDGAGEA